MQVGNSVAPHKKLIVWQKSFNLAREIYRLTDKFPKTERFGVTQQIRRAAVSIVSNIAEGASRVSGKEKIQFFVTARGSLVELETQLLLAKELNYFSNREDIFNEIAEIGKLLNGLIQSRRKSLNLITLITYLLTPITYLFTYLLSPLSYLLTYLLIPFCCIWGFELLQIVPEAKLQAQGVLYQHPARIAFYHDKRLKLYYSNWYFQTNISNISLVFPVHNIITSIDYSIMILEDTYRKTPGEPTQKIRFLNNLISFSFGVVVTDTISFGTTIKYAGQEISWLEKSLRDTLTVFDLGFIFRFIREQTIGISLHNFLISGKTEKPYDTISISGLQKFDIFTFNWGVYLISPLTDTSKVKAGIGVKYPISSYFDLCCGLNYQDFINLSAGFSAKFKRFSLDYCISHHIDLGLTHNLSAGIRF